MVTYLRQFFGITGVPGDPSPKAEKRNQMDGHVSAEKPFEFDSSGRMKQFFLLKMLSHFEDGHMSMCQGYNHTYQ